MITSKSSCIPYMLVTVFFLTVFFLTVFFLSSVPLYASPSQARKQPSKDTPPIQTALPSNPKSQRSLQLNEKAAALAQTGQFEKAEAMLHEAVSLDPKNLSAIFNLASVLIQRGKLQEATFLLEKNAKAVQTDAGLYARLGDVYFSSKKLTKARTAYETALKLDPNLPKIPARLGTVYSLTKGLDKNLELAIEQYLKAVQQEPNNTEYLSNLVNLYLGANNPQKAVSAAKRALQVHPSPELYASLGAAYELQQEWQNSLIAYKRAKDLGDASEVIEQKIEALQSKANNS